MKICGLCICAKNAVDTHVRVHVEAVPHDLELLLWDVGGHHGHCGVVVL